MFDFLFFKKHKDLYISQSHKEIEIQDVFLDSLAQKKEFGEQRVEVPISRTILKIIYVTFVLTLVLFAAKTFELQVIQGNEMTELAQQNAVRTLSLVPDRGVIYDSSLKQLAFNRPSFDFVCDKRDMPKTRNEKEKILKSVSNIFNTPYEELKSDFNSIPAPRILIKENILHEELVLVESRIQDFKGCMVQENSRREYENGSAFAHLIGYTAKVSPDELKEKSGYSVFDQIGKTGVEKYYEEQLRGVPGRIVVERDSTGKTVSEAREIEAEQGKSLVLWLNAGLQERLEESLLQVFKDTGARQAAAVALDPYTGGVLALVSMPSFNNNMFSQGISLKEWNALLEDSLDPLFNRAMSGIGYPTGSVIKPIIGVAALQEGIIKEDTTLFAPLELCVKNIYTGEDECFRDWEYHGWSDIKRAIAESVNTFFYMIGGGHEGFEGLGPLKIKEYLLRFGWGETTGVDLPGEGKGILPEFDKNWRLGDTYHLSIGQGPFTVTPLQVASAFSAIANGGTLLKAKAVQKLIGGEDGIEKILQAEVLRESVANPEVLEIIREGMRQTVTAGSATNWLNPLPVDVAAKTGTAQTGRKTSDGKDYLHSWTVAFAPFENPEIVIVVMVENVIEGNVATLPVVRDALYWYFTE